MATATDWYLRMCRLRATHSLNHCHFHVAMELNVTNALRRKIVEQEQAASRSKFRKQPWGAQGAWRQISFKRQSEKETSTSNHGEQSVCVCRKKRRSFCTRTLAPLIRQPAKRNASQERQASMAVNILNMCEAETLWPSG